MPTRTRRFADTLLDRAYANLDEAASAQTPNAIFVMAYLAACRTAAAIISVKISPEQASRMSRPRNLWEALMRADPSMADWAHAFASRGGQREAAEKDCLNAVYRGQAERLLADAHAFAEVAEGIVFDD